MSLFTSLGTNVDVIDLIIPFIDVQDIIIIAKVCKGFSNQRKTFVKQKFKDITNLNLCAKRLKIISKEIGQLQQLQTLYLNNNKLTLIPTEIGQLQQLQLLDLDYNKLRSIPKEIGQLQQLVYLYLNTTSWHRSPRRFCNLTSFLCAITDV